MSSLFFFTISLLCFTTTSAHQHHHKKHAIAKAARPIHVLNHEHHLIMDEHQPQQIIIALTNTTGELMISWLTWSPSVSPVVKHKIHTGDHWISINATSHSWNDPMSKSVILTRYMHQAKLVNLPASTLFTCQVGDSANSSWWSDPFTFQTIPPANQVLRLAVYGDFGLYNSSSIEHLRNEVLVDKQIDAILHVGDFAYDLHTLNGSIGDAWMNSMQSITSHIPYMGCAGNHEGKYNLTHYSERFALWNEIGKQTGTGHNWWFSWDYHSGGALVHMVAINTEMYYAYVDESNPGDIDLYKQQRKAQYEWLQSDLTAARARGVDWLIVYGHRPMYCSNVDDMPDCSTDAQQLREGYLNKDGTREYGMEALLGQFNVDIYFTAHEHSYERTYPVFQNKFEIHDLNMYTNPKAPVHIVTGSAGCQEFFDYYDNVFYGPWSAIRSSTYGYGHLLVQNKTHLYWDQLLAEGTQGKDIMWIRKGDFPIVSSTGTFPSSSSSTGSFPPSSSSSSTGSSADTDSGNISKGAAAGIVVGIIVALIVGWLLWTWWYNKQIRAAHAQAQIYQRPAPADAHREPLLQAVV